MVAPTRVKRGISSGMAVAPGPLPTTTSTRKSSIARYSISSAGRDIRWISSRKNTSPSASPERIAARSPACWIAGPLEIRSGAAISLAMIIASVVLPSPGGPDSRTWSATPPRFRAASRTRPELVADPRLPFEVRQRRRPERRLGRPLVGSVSGRTRAASSSSVRLMSPAGTPHRGPGSAARPASATAHSTRIVAGQRARRRRTAASASRADQPRPCRPWVTWSRQPAPARRRRRTGSSTQPDGVDLVLELDHDPLGTLAADAGHLAELDQVLAWRSRGAGRRG